MTWVSPRSSHAPPPTSTNPPTGTYILIPPSYTPCPMARRVKVQKLPNDQFIVTIPRALAQALGIEKGDLAEWKLSNGDLVLRRPK